MIVDDPHGRVDAARAAKLADFLGLPIPVEVRALGLSGRALVYGLRLEGGPGYLLRVDVVGNARGYAVDHVVAAGAVLDGVVDLPGPEGLRRVPDSIFGAPAAVFPYTPLTDGVRLIAAGPDAWARVARDLGGALASLSRVQLPGFGLHAYDGRFVAVRSSWRQAWQAHLHGLHRGARALGVDLGPLADRVLAEAHDRLDALDDVERFTLVHGELRATCLQYRGEDASDLARVDGWDLALAGDHLVEVGFLLTLSPATLGPILAAYGPEAAQAWLAPGPLRRIEAYHLGLCLSRPRFVADLIGQTRDTAAIRTLDVARKLCEQALEPDFALRRLEAALEHPEAGPEPDAGVRPDPALTALRVAVSWARGDESVPPSKAPVATAALGAALLGADPGSAAVTEGLAGLTFTLLDAAPRLGRTTGAEGVPDREAWLAELCEDVVRVAGAAPTGSTSALMLAWLAGAALDRLGPTTSDAVLRGVEALVRSCAVADAYPSPRNDVLALQHAVCGLAAVSWLGARFAGVETEAVRADLAARATALVAARAPASQAAPVAEVAELGARLRAPGAVGQRLTRPLVLLALRTLRGSELPAPAEQMLGLLGV